VILALDPKNPQVASRMATAFRSWRTMESGRQAKGQAALRRIQGTSALSRDVSDIVGRALAQSGVQIAVVASKSDSKSGT
jgi:aminopeptidase N